MSSTVDQRMIDGFCISAVRMSRDRLSAIAEPLSDEDGRSYIVSNSLLDRNCRIVICYDEHGDMAGGLLISPNVAIVQCGSGSDVDHVDRDVLENICGYTIVSEDVLRSSKVFVHRVIDVNSNVGMLIDMLFRENLS